MGVKEPNPYDPEKHGPIPNPPPPPPPPKHDAITLELIRRLKEIQVIHKLRDEKRKNS